MIYNNNKKFNIRKNTTYVKSDAKAQPGDITSKIASGEKRGRRGAGSIGTSKARGAPPGPAPPREARRHNRMQGYSRRYGLGEGPALHGRLVLHVLDLLLECVLVHGCEDTGLHGAGPPRDGRGPAGGRGAPAPANDADSFRRDTMVSYTSFGRMCSRFVQYYIYSKLPG